MGLLGQNRDSVVQANFSGADQLSDPEMVQQPNCIALQNCEFVGAGVRSRRGFAPIFSLGKAVGTIWNWFMEAKNRLIYLNLTDNKVAEIDLVANTTVDVITSGIGTPTGMSNAAIGIREMMAFYDSTGLGTTEGRVWDGTFNSGTGAPNVEKLFPRTLLTTEVNIVMSELSAGIVTAGLHNFAIAITTYNGAQAPPGPWSSAAVLVPVTFVSTGSKNLNMALTPATTWPSWVNQIQVMMAPVNNPNNWYLVPGAIQSVPRGSALVVNITFNIDDLTLQAKGLNVTVSGTIPSIFSLYTQDPTSSGPFKPHCIAAFGNRMVYLTRIPGPDVTGTAGVQGAIFVSEAQRPQFITLQFHLINLPEFLDTVTCAVIGATLYVLGPDWTFGFSDNTRYPVQWAPCRTVSRTIGTPFIKGVLANQARGILWVAAKSGLFAFTGGTYDLRPSSYFQGAADWNQINFTTSDANALEITDYPDQRIIIVKAPLGSGQVTANYWLVWDYTLGINADTIRYCGRWWINTASGQLPIGGTALVHYNGYAELWAASNSATNTGKVYRQKYSPVDASSPTADTLSNDDTRGIDAKYRTASPTGVDEIIYQQIGGTFRVLGSGQLALNVYGIDQVNSIPLAPITIPSASASKPAKTFFRAMDMQDRACHYEISNGAVAGQWFWLTKLRHWFSEWLGQGDT